MTDIYAIKSYADRVIIPVPQDFFDREENLEHKLTWRDDPGAIGWFLLTARLIIDMPEHFVSCYVPLVDISFYRE
jgi:hypothetical protein